MPIIAITIPKGTDKILKIRSIIFFEPFKIFRIRVR